MRNLVFPPNGKYMLCSIVVQIFPNLFVVLVDLYSKGWNGQVCWVLAYLTHDMEILVVQFEEMYQGKVNKYVNSNVASGTLEDIQLDLTHSSYTQKFSECCHVCHSQRKLPSLQKTSNWNSHVCQTKNWLFWWQSLVLRIRQKRGKSWKAHDGKPWATKKHPYQLPCTNFFEGYWYGFILFWWLIGFWWLIVSIVKIPPPPHGIQYQYMDFFDWNPRSIHPMIQMIRGNPEGLIPRLVQPRGCDVFMKKRDEKHHFCHGFTTRLPRKGSPLASWFHLPHPPTANATFHSKVSLIRQRYQKALPSAPVN